MDNNQSGKTLFTNSLREIELFDVDQAERSVVVDKVINEAEIVNPAASSADNLTILSKSMVVDGDIVASTAVAINGRLNGNVSTSKELGVSGLVVGDSKSDSAVFNNAKVQGNVSAVEQIVVEDGSIIIGNLTANEINVDGKVKGVIHADRVAEFGETALVVGEVITGTIHMEENARINAKITLSSKFVTEDTEDEFNLGEF